MFLVKATVSARWDWSGLPCLIPLLTLVFLRGDGYHPQTVCLRLHQRREKSDPGHLSNLFYILSGHFDEKNPGVPTNMGVG